MKRFISKTATTIVLFSFLISKVVQAGGALRFPNPLEGLQVGDYVVIKFKLSGFDPAKLQSPSERRLAQNLLNAETTSLKQQAILADHALKLARLDASRINSSNPLLKSRAEKASRRAYEATQRVSKIWIQLERMKLMKTALDGGTLSSLDLERIRLHEFKTLRSVSDVAAVQSIATKAIQKESAILGARVTGIQKFTAGAWAKALALQKTSRMNLAYGALVAGGIVAFVMYSDFEVSRTESRLTAVEE